MRASTSTRWSKELPGKKDGDTEGNSIYPLNSTSLYYRHQSDLITREDGVAGEEKEEKLLPRPYTFSLRNEIRFKGEERRNRGKSHHLVRCSDPSELCLSRSTLANPSYSGSF